MTSDQLKPEEEFVALDAKEQLRRWDEGRSIWSIEMGGMGPGYEQAIQVLAIELVRDHLGKPLPQKGEYRNWGDATVRRIDSACHGFSGAQVGAAKNLAFHWLSQGPAAAQKKVESDRHIQVSKKWPHA